ncbi:hypothetical protein R3P38DRAFT_3123620 [Favolaschia claudopus]|uniref:Secreted protein n=1 Tax=Favolaschia claudopus TaxID=2862362 RepID=A0AAV9ZBK8_9AGAR
MNQDQAVKILVFAAVLSSWVASANLSLCRRFFLCVKLTSRRASSRRTRHPCRESLTILFRFSRTTMPIILCPHRTQFDDFGFARPASPKRRLGSTDRCSFSLLPARIPRTLFMCR